ncbi:hypothetical protein MSAN_00197600 [Mycena sanguinolenta]|uniref:Cytochrome P450 n=1 Tax=Mycena sanguinolenta TaxID=230812 RepID=A0A8H6ZIW4_9AGAR|nr:hypothetical protein MSAN_00197600 [Mycena sanguinolenta]
MDFPPFVLWGTALGLVNHFLFHKYEPSSANIALLVLPVQPVVLLVLLREPFSRLFYTYVVFLGSLSLSIVAYRLSPFHPLARYPGPVIAKVTKLWSTWKTAQGYKYLWHKELHDKYGPYVRTGPDELSVIDATAVCQILNFGGLEKGRYYESGRHKDTPPTIVSLSGEAHTARRRAWNRALTSACIREYEPLIVKRTSQLILCLRDRTHTTVDLVHWLDLFAYGFLFFSECAELTTNRYDLMGDLAFGGGFEMLRDGRDVDGVGERIRGFTKVSYLAGQVPWILRTIHLFPRVAREIQQFNNFGQNLAIQRMKNGAADEGGLEKQKPTLQTSAADGIAAVIGASDTTTSVLNSTVWFLLSNPEYYRRVKQELDTVFVDGDDLFDMSKHQELHFLNEALRLHPPLPSNGPRQIHLGQSGRTIAGRFIPEGTSVYTPAYSLHRNPDYFSPHPDKFLPERWLPDSKFENHDTSAFIPFSLGPANCVGQKFAKREMLMVLSALFKSFDIRFADGFDSEAWPMGMQDFFVVIRGPLLVNLTRRHHGILA